jgi:hypothetical protein
LIEFGLLVLEKKIFKNILSAILLFCYYLPLEKGDPLHLNKLETPLPKDDLCQVWLKMAQWFWRRSQKCKSLQTDGQTDRQTDRQMDRRSDGQTVRWTDDGQPEIRIAHLSFQLR